MKKILVLFILAAVISLTACGSTGTTVTTTPASTTTTTTATTTPTTTAATTTTTPTTTVPPVPASVSTDSVASITFTSAVFNGNLDNPDQESVDKMGFEWGTSSGKYDFEWIQTGTFQSGAMTHLVSDLIPGQMYYFRSKMHIGAAWKYGKELSFRTQEEPEVASIDVASGLLGQTLDVVVTGSGYTDVSAVSFGDGITVNSFKVTDYNNIAVNIGIAAGAATGPRTVSVTTPLGTGTLAGSFTVKQVQTITRTVVWRNADFDTLLHQLTSSAAAQYEIRLHDNNQMTVVSTQSVSIWAEVRDGKIAFTGVTQSIWDTIFSTAGRSITYDSVNRVMTINTLPDTVLSTMFTPAETSTPRISSVVTGEGLITVKYFSLAEV